MEAFLEGLGTVAFVLLVIVGALAGLIASRIAGGGTLLYMVVGIVAAVLTPFILAAVGLSVLALGGIFLLLVAGMIGALIVLAIVQAITGRGNGR